METVTCPHCSSWVTPTRSPEGKLLCPSCNNRGASPFGHGTHANYQVHNYSPENAPGAVPALVLGILSLVIPYVGWILGIIALVQAKTAKRAIQQNPSLQGQGMATAGKVMGIISLIIWLGVVGSIFLAAIVFVLVNNLDGGNSTATILAHAF